VNTLGPRRRARFKFGQPSAQSRSIELIDGKRANAALGASRAADQPFAAAMRDIG
jgi:hypothetical protein